MCTFEIFHGRERGERNGERRGEKIGGEGRGQDMGGERKAGEPERWEEKIKNVESQKLFFKQEGDNQNSQTLPGGQIK